MENILVSHEWIESVGGSENVFRELLNVFESASSVCLWNDVPEEFAGVEQTFLSRTALRRSKAAALFAMPRAWKSVDLRSFDTVIASSHAFGHHLAARAAREGLRAFAYIHTPARYLWASEVETRGQGLGARLAGPMLRRLDRRATDPRVRLAANSKYVQRRIAESWDADAEVIYPPVKVAAIQARSSWRDSLSADELRVFEAIGDDGFVLGASRLVEYKNLDAAVRTGELLRVPVVVAGAGPDEARLRAAATSATVPVIFTGRVSDQMLYALFQEATLFCFMAVEDFGIMPVEAMALGTPVIVNAEGGASESVSTCFGGSVAEDGSDEALRAAARRALACSPAQMMTEAQRFDTSRFHSEVRSWVGKEER